MGGAGGMDAREGTWRGSGNVRTWMHAVQQHLLEFREHRGMSRMRLIQLAYLRRGK